MAVDTTACIQMMPSALACLHVGRPQQPTIQGMAGAPPGSNRVVASIESFAQLRYASLGKVTRTKEHAMLEGVQSNLPTPGRE